MEWIALLFIFVFLLKQNNQLSDLQRSVRALKKRLDAYESAPEKAPEPVREAAVKEVALKREQLPKREVSARPEVTEQRTTARPAVSTPKGDEPARPSWVAQQIRNYFTQGNIVVRIGSVILFFGLAFLVKFATDRGFISIEIRLFALMILGFGIAVAGWRLRHREGHYGLILQGLGLAIAYLVIFSAAKIYGLIGLPLAFALMFAMVLIGSALAVGQNALPLALFALGGGFITPILSSDGSGSHVVLFSYYALLNLGIVLIAWYRSWRVLNLTGFLFTFCIAVVWGVLRYESELFSTTEPFLILFFLFYLTVSILFTRRQQFNPKEVIDATLVFGVPLTAFALQVKLLHFNNLALSGSAVVLGTLYLVLYKFLSSNESTRGLSRAFMALGIVFYTVAIPYAFDDKITAALWALEGAAAIFISLKQGQRYGRWFGEALQGVATILFAVASTAMHPETAYLNGRFLGFVVIVGAALFSAYLLERERKSLQEVDDGFRALFLGSGLLLWIYAGLVENGMSTMHLGNLMLGYLAVSTAVFAWIALRYRWQTLARSLQLYLPAGGVFLMMSVPHYIGFHPFEGIGSIALGLFFGVHYLLLARFEEAWSAQRYLHMASLWTIVLLLNMEFGYGASQLVSNPVWLMAAWALPSIAVVLWLRYGRFFPKGFAAYRPLYLGMGQNGILLLLTGWQLYALTSDADPSPWIYLPLLNPLEGVQLLGLVLIYRWYNASTWFEEVRRSRYGGYVWGVILLSFLTVLLARSTHFYFGIDYAGYPLLHSSLFHTVLSVCWSVVGLALIAVSKYVHQRRFWLMGAVLMGVVVLKLFLVDLSNSGTIERIVSFIVVGALLLLVGYFAPLPPKQEADEAASSSEADRSAEGVV